MSIIDRLLRGPVGSAPPPPVVPPRIPAPRTTPAPTAPSVPSPPPGSPAAKVELAKVKEEELPEVDTQQLKEDRLREERRWLGIKPTPSEELSERGQVLIPQPEEPSDTFAATQVSDVLLERGVGRPPPPPPPLTQPERIERAETESRERIAEQRGRVGFERRFQPIAQTVTQKKYNELINRKATELGMVWDAGQGAWTGDQSQIERFREYLPEAEVEAMTFGTDYYQRQWEQIGLGEHAEEITREEFGEEGFKLIEKPDGTFTVITEAEFEKQQRVKKYTEEYRERELGEPLERLGTLFEFWVSGFTAGDPFWTKTIGELLVGKEEGKAERLLDIRAGASYEWTTAIKEQGFEGAIGQTLGPGSPLFTLGAAYVGGQLLGGAIGAVGYIAGPVATKGIGVGVGGYFLGRSAVDVEQLAMGRIVKYGPLGLVPLGLMKQDQPLTEAERFSSFAMLGISLPFAISGYRSGLKTGKRLASQIYTPEYKTLSGYAYQKVKPIEGIDSEWGVPVKGDVFRTETKVRTIFGRAVPFGKTTTTVSGEFKGIIGKKELSVIRYKTSLKSITGKEIMDYGRTPFDKITWRPGEFRGELTSVKLTKTVFGVDLVKNLKHIDGVFTAYPSRPLKVDLGKRMGVDIEPYVKRSGMVSIIKDTPGMTLTLSKLQAGRPLFKAGVVSKFFPSESISTFKDVTSKDRGVAQMFELSDTAAVMKLPHVEKIKVGFFEYGETIPEYKGGAESTEGILGFTYTKGPLSEPRVYVREPGTGPVVSDIFGRKSIRDPTSAILRHETLHRIYPGLKESEVQLLEGKRFPRKSLIPDYVARETSIREMKQFHKQAKPIVKKAVGEFWKTGEIGISVQTGLDVFKVAGFRQVVSRVSPTEIVSGVVFGQSAVLTGMEKAGVETISESVKAWDTSKDLSKRIGKTETGLVKPSELVVKYPEIKVGVIDIDAARLWGKGVDVGIMTSTIPATISKSESVQMRRTTQSEVNLSKIMQSEIQKRLVTQLSSSLLRQDLITETDTSSKLETRLASAQAQMSLQATRLVTAQVTATPTVTAPTIIITPPVVMGLQNDLMKGISLQPQAYDVYTYKTQFKDGRRIRGKEPMKINKKPLRRLDALALGSNRVDNNAKRTIILKPVEGKPTKLKKKVRGWTGQMFEYNDKGNDRWVEKNTHAIDSPGELREITMKGLSARKRGSKRGNNGLPMGINNLDKRMSRRLII